MRWTINWYFETLHNFKPVAFLKTERKTYEDNNHWKDQKLYTEK